jgi:hypothetical protein
LSAIRAGVNVRLSQSKLALPSSVSTYNDDDDDSRFDNLRHRNRQNSPQKIARSSR